MGIFVDLESLNMFKVKVINVSSGDIHISQSFILKKTVLDCEMVNLR